MVFASLVAGAKRFALGTGGATPMLDLFPKTDPAVDGDECSHDCESCHIKYPRGFKIETEDALYGVQKGFSTHLLVATGKTDWVREIEDEKGSVMEAIGKAAAPSNGVCFPASHIPSRLLPKSTVNSVLGTMLTTQKLMLSATNMPTPHGTSDYDHPTTVLLLPAFTIIENVTPANVPALLTEFVEKAPTNTSPLEPLTLPRSLPAPDSTDAQVAALVRRPSPHSALVLLCSQKTRDARCGQSAPLIRKELERHLRPLGLARDLDDHRPGGVGIYFISHVGGHKYSANVIVYRKPDAFGLDSVQRATAGGDVRPKVVAAAANGAAETEEEAEGDVGVGQCIWLARIMPEDCENLVRYTILQGKVVKPETQLRGGFDRGRGVMSW
ncbi:actin patches distal protein [Verticillium alfalfae VaMs.102]|uniref:Actin patches distal protein n=1 Tax=Verticillium alfalfae (strain VaMs.102 / ATCC MYA-4576 / FGSC 10136) TaxID=526221 RepID=C9ST20_VERA1|nr:actin patches distal protein [Verticillium alfalfae VaMs.102]EEY21935.1 actin patches distal protein [Verticillium alfalfae VaMs.102]